MRYSRYKFNQFNGDIVMYDVSRLKDIDYFHFFESISQIITWILLRNVMDFFRLQNFCI